MAMRAEATPVLTVVPTVGREGRPGAASAAAGAAGKSPVSSPKIRTIVILLTECSATAATNYPS